MLPPEAFVWIDENVKQGGCILEFGSGNGSQRLAQGYNVWSIEHDKEWLGIASVNYLHCRIVDNPVSTSVGEMGWYDPSTFSVLPSEVDLIVVDGPPGDIGRSGLLNYLDILPKARIMLVDDVDREAEANLLKQLLLNGAKELSIIDSQLLRYDGSKRLFAIITQPIVWGQAND